MGYDGVEISGIRWDTSGREIRKMLDDLGLGCCGMHTILEGLSGDGLARSIDYAVNLGTKFILLPWLFEPQRPSTREGWLKLADLLNGVAARLKPLGLRVGYHHHDFEFVPVGKNQPFDLVFGHTTPDVFVQIDTGNAVGAGQDPVFLMKRYPRREATIHLKEYPKELEIGQGRVQWKEILAACETIGGTEWYVIEDEVYPQAPLAKMAGLLKTLREFERQEKGAG